MGSVILSTYDAQVDLFDFPNGVYIIRVIGEEQLIFQTKFIKVD